MIHIAICEDERNLSILLENLIYKVIDEDTDFTCEIDVFNCPEDFFEHREKLYDIYFLDIEFANSTSNGLDIAKSISNESGTIVFVSSHPGYSIESIKYKPFRYLLKPVDEQKVRTLFRELIKENQEKKVYIRFKSGRDNVYINCERILCITNEDNRRLRICFADGAEDEIYYGKTSESEAQLPTDLFARANKGLIVNLRYVSSLNKGVITLKNGLSDTLSRGRKKSFEEAMHRYLFDHPL